MKKLCLIASLAIMAVIFNGCGLGHDYNLTMNPPANDASPAQIFPEEIAGDVVVVNNLEYGGLQCMYGKDKSIIGARLSSTEEAEAYFKNNLLPDFQAQSNNFSGNINGQYYAKASGDWHLFGWVNQNFAFVIKATSQEGLDQIVDAFQYIEKN